jgi:hypothetical protein
MMEDRNWWRSNNGMHYRELATWLREIASKCRLQNPRRELLTLANAGDERAPS